MPKLEHEVRDAVHGFVKFNSLERDLINSQPFQRLRSIRQLAMTPLIYPGAVHNRFEHSIGVMELAGRVFDQVFNVRIQDEIYERIGNRLEEDEKQYWRQVMRVAGLLHDVGHLPFSHAAEKELLPEGWNHERITAALLRESEIQNILENNKPPIEPEDVVDVAWDASKRTETEPESVETLGAWKHVLNELICGDTFGADRIDYLLRDSWHAGVRYGQFDPARLVSGLTLVLDPGTEEISLALEHSAIHAAEALLVARYFMYKQVYFHDVRRVYDLHLKEFLQRWLPNGNFPVDWRDLLLITDDEVMAALRASDNDMANPAHGSARRILRREHFRTVYESVPSHVKSAPSVVSRILDYCTDKFGSDNVRKDEYRPKAAPNEFLVLINGRERENSLRVSTIIKEIPPASFRFVFVDPLKAEEAKRDLSSELPRFLKAEENDEEE